LDSPAEFDVLPPAKQAALLAWIAQVMKPASTFGRHTSYGIKHAFEDVGFYVTNGEFKGAMLVAGYVPKDPDELNWTFKARPRVRGLGIASTYAEALGYTREERAA
jgi:hypothetical protein